MKKIAMALSGALLLAGLAGGAEQPIRVSVSPKVAIEPTDLFIMVETQRDADNRILRVSAESDDYFSGSDRQLEGESSPRVASFQLRDVPAGTYDIRAEIFGRDGRVRLHAEARAMVVSRGH